VRKRADDLGELTNLFDRLSDCLQREGQSHQQQRQLSDHHDAVKKNIAAQTEQLADANKELQRCRDQRQETAADLEAVERLSSKGIVALRAALKPGEACPVCGAREHPGHPNEHGTELVADLRARALRLDQELTRLETKCRELGQQVAANDAKATAFAEQLDDVVSRRAQLWIETEAAADKVRQRVEKQLSGKWPADNKALTALLARLQKQHEKDVRSVNEQLQAVQAMERALAVANRTLQQAEQQLEAHRPALEALDREHRQAAASQAQLEQAQQRASDRLHDGLDHLIGLLGGVDISRADLLRDLAAAERFVVRGIEETLALQLALQRFEKQVREQAADQSLLQERHAQTRERAAEIAREMEKLQKRVEALVQGRHKLFAGRAVDEVRAELATVEQDLLSQSRKAAAAVAGLETTTNDLTSRQKQLAKELKGGEQAHGKAQKARDKALAKLKMQLEEAVELLAVAPEERVALGEKLKTLDERLGAAEAQLSDRQQQLDDTRKALDGQMDQDAAEQSITENSDRLAALLERLGKNRTLLQRDDEARQKREGVAGRITEAEQRQRVWGALNEAIGSANGAQFRRFVQGVTLDHLVVHANEHMRSINPRYRIERNPLGGLGLQMLDLDMGGEVRSTRSLSGGERFLVSLTLALALSKLDGRAAFIDTLLIDEGFGSLDARSLDMAVEALERLQGEGRRVGVISHVDALKERIAVQVLVEKQGEGRSRVKLRETVNDWEAAYEWD
jgi:exonuclease SbcC